MERWALWPLAGVLGTALQLQQAGLGPVGRAQAALLAALALLAWAARSAGRAATLAGLLACAALGWAAAEWRAIDRLADRLEPSLEGVDLQLTGVVAELPHSNLIGTRFVLQVESARRQGQPVRVPERVALHWGRGLDGDAWLLGPESLRAGQRWRLTARLRLPHGAANPMGFDAELWWFEQGLGATGSVRSRPGDPAVRLDERAGAPVERLRQHLRDRIDAAVPDAAAGGVLAALVIGDQGAIDRAEWELFRVTGVAHLMRTSKPLKHN